MNYASSLCHNISDQHLKHADSCNSTESDIEIQLEETSEGVEECSSSSDHIDNQVLTETPIIGILTTLRTYETYNTYVMSTYEKFVEQMGGKAVPIKQFDSDEDTLALLEKINGVIIPGGTIVIIDEERRLSHYGSKIKLIVDKAKEMNDKGIHFPIWGV